MGVRSAAGEFLRFDLFSSEIKCGGVFQWDFLNPTPYCILRSHWAYVLHASNGDLSDSFRYADLDLPLLDLYKAATAVE